MQCSTAFTWPSAPGAITGAQLIAITPSLCASLIDAELHCPSKHDRTEMVPSEEAHARIGALRRVCGPHAMELTAPRHGAVKPCHLMVSLAWYAMHATIYRGRGAVDRRGEARSRTSKDCVPEELCSLCVCCFSQPVFVSFQIITFSSEHARAAVSKPHPPRARAVGKQAGKDGTLCTLSHHVQPAPSTAKVRIVAASSKA